MIMGKYKYIIYNRYPNDIFDSGVIWAFTERLANKKISKKSEDRLYVLYKIYD